jgi:hypothetical protein
MKGKRNGDIERLATECSDDKLETRGRTEQYVRTSMYTLSQYESRTFTETPDKRRHTIVFGTRRLPPLVL